jgi:hypothetical protein
MSDPTVPGSAPEPEPVPIRSSPRRSLDSPDLTCDWTPYIIPGRVGFVHYDCLDCLTRVTVPVSRLCPDRVQHALATERAKAAEAEERARVAEAAASLANAHALELSTGRLAEMIALQAEIRDIVKDSRSYVPQDNAAEMLVALDRAKIDRKRGNTLWAMVLDCIDERDEARAKIAHLTGEVEEGRRGLAAIVAAARLVLAPPEHEGAHYEDDPDAPICAKCCDVAAANEQALATSLDGPSQATLTRLLDEARAERTEAERLDAAVRRFVAAYLPADWGEVEGAVAHRSWRGYVEVHVWTTKIRGPALEISVGDRFTTVPALTFGDFEARCRTHGRPDFAVHVEGEEKMTRLEVVEAAIRALPDTPPAPASGGEGA